MHLFAFVAALSPLPSVLGLRGVRCVWVNTASPELLRWWYWVSNTCIARICLVGIVPYCIISYVQYKHREKAILVLPRIVSRYPYIYVSTHLSICYPYSSIALSTHPSIYLLSIHRDSYLSVLPLLSYPINISPLSVPRRVTDQTRNGRRTDRTGKRTKFGTGEPQLLTPRGYLMYPSNWGGEDHST